MNRFIAVTDQGEKVYTPVQIQKAHPRLYYWLMLPKKITITCGQEKIQTQFLVVPNKKIAFRKAKKYHALSVSRMLDCDLGRWELKTFTLFK